jgi:hypothetical protein
MQIIKKKILAQECIPWQIRGVFCSFGQLYNSLQCLYLLQKSIARYEYLKKSRALDILVNAEKILIRRQLLFLFNLRTELMKFKRA